MTSQLIGLLDVLLLEGADGHKAAGQRGFQLLPLGQWLTSPPGLVFDAQSGQEDAELVWRTVGQQHLDVLWEQFDGALPLFGELGEQLKLLQAVALRDFPVVDPEDELLELIPAEDDGGFADELPASGLTGGVKLLQSHTALELCTIFPEEHSCHGGKKPTSISHIALYFKVLVL